MATVSKTYTENTNTSYKATWVLSATGTDLAPTTNAFTVSLPTLSAKYTYSGKSYASVDVSYDVYINNINTYQRFRYYRGQQGDSGKLVATTSGSTYTLSPYSNNTTKTLYLSNYFTSSNPTVRTLPITIQEAYGGSTYLSSGNTSNTDGSMFNCYQGGTAVALGTIGYLTLNAPPTATLGTPSYSNPQYAGLGVYTVDVTTSSAQYGGTIQSITLTIGSQTDTKNFSATTVTNQTFTIIPAVAGTFTPTITIADSRGQTTVKTLPQITVNAYTAPSMSFDLARCDVDGIPQAEGEHGLVTANITYVDAIAELTQPTVSVKDSNDSTIISSTTWYETWDAVNGVDDAVNWTNYNPTSPVTLYAIVSATGSEFSPNESYTVSITPTDNMGGVAQTISQTLATGFFTIDFQAGGKEIAFGAPANDDLTLHPNGLFKCNMDAWFNGNVHMQGGNRVQTRKLLYTNTTAPFSAQTVSLDLSDYDYVEVWFSQGGTVDALLPNPMMIPIGEFRNALVVHNINTAGTNENTGARLVTVSTTGVTFGNYGYKNRRSGGTVTTANNFAVPHYIYGIKYL